MARTRSMTWTVIISLLLGIAVATLFWLYSPYGHDQLVKQVADDLKSQQGSGGGKGKTLDLKLPPQAVGSRFQMMTDGKQVFVVDMKSGRAWRYFHQTREEGGREDEGFLPIPFYYAGKKHYAASEIEEAPGASAAPAAGEKSPQ